MSFLQILVGFTCIIAIVKGVLVSIVLADILLGNH